MIANSENVMQNYNDAIFFYDTMENYFNFLDSVFRYEKPSQWVELGLLTHCADLTEEKAWSMVKLNSFNKFLIGVQRTQMQRAAAYHDQSIF